LTGRDYLLWAPTPERQAQAKVTRFLSWLAAEQGRSFNGYRELWQWSVDELEAFWEAVLRFYGLDSEGSAGAPLAERCMPGARWFADARLNYAEQVLARAPRDRPAIVHLSESDGPVELSTEQLGRNVGALAATLRELGIGPGDRVAAYVPNIPEAVIAMLAVASLGATWAACAPDFGTPSVVDRFAQIEPKLLLAVDGYRWGDRDFDRREAIEELQAAMPGLRATIVIPYLHPGEALPGQSSAMTFEQACGAPQPPSFEKVGFDHPLWILFSSGTTGLPKGIIQSHGGILLEHLKSLGLCLDLGSEDRYLFYSSTSWMAWNYLVSGLLHGSTIVLYNGSPTSPSPDALWRIASTTRATVLGMGAAYVTGCEKADVKPGADLDLDSLRTVIPTGSPLPPSGWRWLHSQLGSGVRIDPICGGTDVCTAFFGGSELLPVHSGEISCRWLGVDAKAYDSHGHEVVDQVGEFVVTAPMPSMPVGLWNDPLGTRYRAAYFAMYPGAWRQGDWITISETGGVTVSGRSDATLNRGGVRIGSAEIYAAVERLPEIADSLIVGVELDDGDYYMPLFVVPAPSFHGAVETIVKQAIRQELSPRYVPDEVITVAAIPRTLTGKKLEVPVKRILQGVAPDRAAAAGSVDRFDALAWFAEFGASRRTKLQQVRD
jgi:acetoacetyl-CoA synthetase